MIRQLHKYAAKLTADGSVDPARMALLARDDQLLSTGETELLPLGKALIERLDVVSLVVAAPPLPLIDLLLVILIFLMVTTTYNRFAELKINLPTASAEPGSWKPGP